MPVGRQQAAPGEDRIGGPGASHPPGGCPSSGARPRRMRGPSGMARPVAAGRGRQRSGGASRAAAEDVLAGAGRLDAAAAHSLVFIRVLFVIRHARAAAERTPRLQLFRVGRSLPRRQARAPRWRGRFGATSWRKDGSNMSFAGAAAAGRPQAQNPPQKPSRWRPRGATLPRWWVVPGAATTNGDCIVTTLTRLRLIGAAALVSSAAALSAAAQTQTPAPDTQTAPPAVKPEPAPTPTPPTGMKPSDPAKTPAAPSPPGGNRRLQQRTR